MKPERAASALGEHSLAATARSKGAESSEGSAEWLPRHGRAFRPRLPRLLSMLLPPPPPPPRRGRASGSPGAVSLRAHQRTVAAFLARGSPHRGLLLYHGLGSGKTCAAAAAAQAVAADGGVKNIVVLLPASLKPNFAAEFAKCAPGVLAADGPALHYFSTNGVAARDIDPHECTVKGVCMHEAVVIVDEVHNLVSQISNGGRRGVRLYDALMNARFCKIIMLSGTPIINSPHEIAYLFNMLNGPVRALEFRGPRLDAAAAAAALAAHPRVDVFRQDGRVVRVLPTPEGFARSAVSGPPGALVRDPEIADDPLKVRKPPAAALMAELAAALGAGGRPCAARRLNGTLFPADREGFDRIYLDGDEEGESPRPRADSSGLKNAASLQRRVHGLVSHYALTAAEARQAGFPEVVEGGVHRLPMTDTQYAVYLAARKLEIELSDAARSANLKREKSSARGRKAGKGDKGADKAAEAAGVYRTLSRAVCNFAFKRLEDRPFPSGARAFRAEAEGLVDSVNEEEGAAGDAARKRDKAAASAEYGARLAAALAGLGPSELEAGALEEHSPKMAAILRAVRAGPGPSLVYSQFRLMEGLGIFARVLEHNGYSRMRFDRDEEPNRKRSSPNDKNSKRRPRFLVFDSADPGNERALAHFNAEAGPADVLLISQSAAEGINLVGVRQVHIMEPYWNEIRIQQVIGRAARNESHAHLPPAQRRVTVHRYVVALEHERHRAEKALLAVDRGLSSDEIVMNLARAKMRVVQQFLDAIAASAIDCRPTAALRCAPAFNRPDSVDGTTFDVFSQTDRRLLHVRKDGMEYVMDPDTRQLFEFETYERTGRLVRVQAARPFASPSESPKAQRPKGPKAQRPKGPTKL